MVWKLQWHADCEDLANPDPNVRKFRSVQVARNTTDRLISWAARPPKSNKAMRAEVLQGDVAWNPSANGGNGAAIAGGWRAEAVGPAEFQANQAVRYEWSTMLDPDYAVSPTLADGSRPWQVVFQWHQGDNDQGGSPPVALTIVKDDIRLDVHTVQGGQSVQVGEWPLTTLNRGTWHDFAAEVTWHPTAGAIKMWHNGQPIRFDPVPSQAKPGQMFPAQTTDTLTNLTTLFPRKVGSPDPSSVYLKVGLYRRAANTTPKQTFVVYHDEIRRFTWSP